MSEWISVADRLPDDKGIFVDIWCKSRDNLDYGTRYTEVCFIDGKFKFNASPGVYISHWMPLPGRPL